jgi:hypothetical protein
MVAPTMPKMSEAMANIEKVTDDSLKLAQAIERGLFGTEANESTGRPHCCAMDTMEDILSVLNELHCVLGSICDKL